MSHTLEIEKTYLAKYIPADVALMKSKFIRDIYIADVEKSTMRLRQNGDTYELTKKVQVNVGDASQHTEYTIPLSRDEFLTFAGLSNLTVEKNRYYYPYGEHIIEIDIFSGSLQGLVLVDVEFLRMETYTDFKMPDFCLVDVTQEDFIAGKFLVGKSISDMQTDLNRLNYVQLSV